VSFHDGSAMATSFTVEVVQAWLVSLVVVPKVSLGFFLADHHEHCRVEEAARQRDARLKLPLPAVL
jgi:hypothetical protein